MNFAVVTLTLVALIESNAVEVNNTAYGYLKTYGVPAAERIRQAEEMQLRIAGGEPNLSGQIPWHAGLIIDLIEGNLTSVCGAALVTNSRLVTAAHCWADGVSKAWRFKVVLGTNHLFSGGTRIDTSVVTAHPKWNPKGLSNDIAVIYLPAYVAFTKYIAPISLPLKSELNGDLTGEYAIASGFSRTPRDVYLSHVCLVIMANQDCAAIFPEIQDSNVCTSGVYNGVPVGPCGGDGGGPLILTKNNKNFLIGVTSYGHTRGCEDRLPTTYARITSFLDFLKLHIYGTS